MRVHGDAAAHLQSDSCVTRYQRFGAEIERDDLTDFLRILPIEHGRGVVDVWQ
jgi:hypothetical protein